MTLLKKTMLPLALAVSIVGFAPAPVATAASPGVEQCVLGGINAQRAKYGRRALQPRWPLRKAARARASSMAHRRYFAHVSPSGVDAWDLLRSYGRAARDMGEAIGKNYGYSSVGSCRWMVRWWMNSRPHRELLMKPNRRIIGVGVVRWGTRTWLVALPAARQWRR
jgi:uncharacterized protein YkwD